ncbi:MAG: hypothetical protein RSD06_01515 [Bacilli bacterium]
MKKRNGFTLAELLGVVILMGVLILVVVVPITNGIRKNKNKLDKMALDLLYTTANTYMDKNGSNYSNEENAVYYISLGQLIDSKDLEEEFLSSYNSSVLSRNSIIKVSAIKGSYNFLLLDVADYQNLGNIEKTISTSNYTFMGGTYYSNNPTNNYVEYSGMYWRILGRNKDGSIKLILVEDAASLILSNTGVGYKDSYVREWLNTYFLSKLENNDIILKEEWCTDEAVNETTSKTDCTNIIKNKVGLLTSYENVLTTDKNLLKNYSIFSTMTGVSGSPGTYYRVGNTGSMSGSQGGDTINYVRPIINVSPNVAVTSGNGLIATPYVINKSVTLDYTNKELSKTKISISDYIKYNNNVYRVTEINEEFIKATSSVIIDSLGTTSFGTSNYSSTDGIGFFLNNTKYTTFTTASETTNLLVNNFLYNGLDYLNGSNYKMTSMKNNEIVINASIGVPKAGELFSAMPYVCSVSGTCPNSAWLMTTNNNSNSYSISLTNPSTSLKTESKYTIPTINISNKAKITSGKGRYTDPFVISPL